MTQHTMFNAHTGKGNIMTEHYKLPANWAWRDVVAMRAKWAIPDRFYPITVVPGQCVAWGRPMSSDGTRYLETAEIA